MVDTVTAEVEVEVPIWTAYNQWTQFEEFPEFLGGVKSVTQLSDALTHWDVSVGGVRREFDAEIIDQLPDQHVEWASVDGKAHRGRVSFEPISLNRTRVALAMVWEPETVVEKVGAAVGLDERQVEMDLMRFKRFIEERRDETGAWRGEIHDGDVQRPAREGERRPTDAGIPSDTLGADAGHLGDGPSIVGGAYPEPTGS